MQFNPIFEAITDNFSPRGTKDYPLDFFRFLFNDNGYEKAQERISNIQIQTWPIKGESEGKLYKLGKIEEFDMYLHGLIDNQFNSSMDIIKQNLSQILNIPGKINYLKILQAEIIHIIGKTTAVHLNLLEHIPYVEHLKYFIDEELSIYEPKENTNKEALIEVYNLEHINNIHKMFILSDCIIEDFDFDRFYAVFTNQPGKIHLKPRNDNNNGLSSIIKCLKILQSKGIIAKIDDKKIKEIIVAFFIDSQGNEFVKNNIGIRMSQIKDEEAGRKPSSKPSKYERAFILSFNEFC